MGRPKKKISHARSFRIREDIGIQLDQYSEDTMIPKTAVVERALSEYFDRHRRDADVLKRGSHK